MFFWGSLIQATGHFKRSTAYVDPGDQGPPQLSRTGKVNGGLETLPGSLRGEGRMGVESNLAIISVVCAILLWVKRRSRVQIGWGKHIKEGEEPHASEWIQMNTELPSRKVIKRLCEQKF